MDDATLSTIETVVDTYAKDYAQAYAQKHFIANDIGTSFQGLHLYPQYLAEALKRWTFPANVGNTDPVAKVFHGSHIWLPGDPASFSCNSSPSNEDNFYAYMKLPLPSSLPSQIIDERRFLVGNLAHLQALEWQWQLTVGGITYNGAYQLSTTSGMRTFNFTTGKWEGTGLPIPDLTKPLTISGRFILSPTTCVHDSININGVLTLLNIVRTPTQTGKPDKFTIAFQVDPKRGGSPSLQISQTDLRYV